MQKPIQVPDIGDFSGVDVIEVLVAPGDTVDVEQPILSLESDKATMEVPSPEAGTVVDVKVAVGDKVSEGDIVLILETADAAAEEAKPAEPAPAAAEAAPAAAGNEVGVSVPDIGDFSEVEVIEVLVSPGDTVAVDDALITLESDKASMEIPSTEAGVVKEVKVAVGDKVSEGDLVVTVAVSSGPAAAPAPAAETAPAAAPAPAAPAGDIEVCVPDIGDFADVEVIEVLVSVGEDIKEEDALITLESDKASMEVPSSATGKVKEVKVSVGDRVSKGRVVVVLEGAAAPAAAASAPAPAAEADMPRQVGEKPPSAPPVAAPADAKHGGKPHASPAVRRFARELGVDLYKVTGSGNKGRITKEDVQQFVKRVMTSQTSAPAGEAQGGAGIPPIPVQDFSKFGEIELQPLNRIKKISGAHLHRCWLNVPHVTQFDEADISEMEAFRKSLKSEAERKGMKMTPLIFIMKALVKALQEFPQFNSSLDPDGENLILKKFYHIGIAVDTPNGLMVPVVRDVDQKGLWDLAGELADISVRAREGKLGPKDMTGGCMSISSLGGIGGTSFTPIVNAPEVAILGLSRSKTQPVWNDSTGEFEPKLMLPMSLSYDHRVIDGADGARFTSYLAAVLGDIRRLLL